MEAESLFVAKAESLYGTMGSHAGKVGFKIPDYQRTYDWSKENIKRLLEDCINGFYNCWKTDSSYTFLGTIILVKEKSQDEPRFDGTSLEVVDGQQRLTTLALLCTLLIQRLNERQSETDELRGDLRQWIDSEIQFHLDALFECVVGQLPERGKTFPFPRIIRNGDSRAANSRYREYQSVISRFLYEFAKYYGDNERVFQPTRQADMAEEERLFDNYEYISEQISLALNGKDCDLDLEPDPTSDFGKRSVRGLFEKLDAIPEQQDRDRAIGAIGRNGQLRSLFALMAFASYITKCVVLTRVETDDDRYAFDIFDALNTTGEPLTAIETLRPRIIQFEQEATGRFSSSESKTHLDAIRQFVDEVYVDTAIRQKVTKELIVSFALYFDGSKRGLNLNAQRNYLRGLYENFGRDVDGQALRRRFVGAISDFAEFRYQFWDAEGIRHLDSFQFGDLGDRLKLCFDFIRSMNTSLALPLLARYWVALQRNVIGEQTFVQAVQAVTSFIVLRRAATGTTSGIDSDFRQLMRDRPSVGGDPLCAGVSRENALLPVVDLAEELRSRYLKKPCDASDREAWVNMASGVALGRHSRPLCRFLLLAAADGSRPDSASPGLLTRSDVRPSDELGYLNFVKWDGDKYATVEHVAPDSGSIEEWDARIYRDLNTRNAIGNLILLPQKENSSAGNMAWDRKKVFYTALRASTTEEKDKAIGDAKRMGYSFGKKTERLLASGERLHMLDPIVSVVTWDKDLIDHRSQRILHLAWDLLWEWLPHAVEDKKG